MLFYRFVLYRSKTLKNGKHPVLLQITSNGKIKRVSTGMDACPKDWDENKQRFKKEKNKNIKLDELNQYAQLIYFELSRDKKLMMDEFVRRIKNENVSVNAIQFFDTRIKELQLSQKAGNAFVYNNARSSLVKYAGENLLFTDIDYKFLMAYENHLRQFGAEDGGVSTYMRTIRAVINEAIRRGVIESNRYPFSTQFNKNGYSISKLKVKMNPRALSADDLEKLKAYHGQEDYYLMFMFMYYTYGLNFADLARLTRSNIQGNTLRYTRKKTQKAYTLPLHEEAKRIIEHFNGQNYLFPIFTDFHKTEQQKLHRIMKKRQHFNTFMRKLGKSLGIETPITSYVARHSIATNLKRKKVSSEVISQLLGHSDIKTTNHYLAQFDNDVLVDTLQYA